jgi:hypothetical protein
MTLAAHYTPAGAVHCRLELLCYKPCLNNIMVSGRDSHIHTLVSAVQMLAFAYVTNCAAFAAPAAPADPAAAAAL